MLLDNDVVEAVQRAQGLRAQQQAQQLLGAARRAVRADHRERTIELRDRPTKDPLREREVGEVLVVVDDPVVEVFLEDGRAVALRGANGRVFLEGKELQRVELSGDISVRLDTYTMRMDAAHYEAGRGVIVAPGAVRIDGEGFQLLGERMEVDVEDQRLVLSDKVHTTLWPKGDT